jgi:3-phosphoshikimate 1-carboxyvinyltransferase
MDKLIRPIRNVEGALRVPGDKSISHRYAMLGAIANGISQFRNFATGADCASTLACIQALGAKVERGEDSLRISSEGWQLPSGPLDCGNSGSTMRMLTGLIAGKNVAATLVGDESLSRRPMLRIATPLRAMGASIEDNRGCPPLVVRRAEEQLRGISYSVTPPSAQVKSCLLFAGLFAQGRTEVSETIRTRDHGELALRAFGARVERSKESVSIECGQPLNAIDAYIPGDISSAAYFLCASALFADSNLVIDSVGMNPTRAAILDVLTMFGARVNVLNLEEQHGELLGTVRVQPGALFGGTISGSLTARLIDELPLLAAIAPYTEQGIEIRDAKELRVKETDRITATAENLRRMGAQVEEFDDGLRVNGNQPLYGAEVESFGDHRIGMAFAVAALKAKGDTLIRNAEAVNVSFPEFWESLERVVVS